MHPEIKTPYYIADESLLVENLEKIKYVREKSGAKSLLALKCFSMWSVFPLMSQYMDGTTSSSLYEAQLGHEKFGGETQGYSVAWSKEDIDQLKTFADKIIFNSIAQLERFHDDVSDKNIGLRINPGMSYSHYDLADPARKGSRLGVKDIAAIEKVADKIKGLMFHVNCENEDFGAFSKIVDMIGNEYGALLKKMEWVSLGGGVAFTSLNYPIDDFAARLKKFSEDFDVQVYLEPGDAAVTMAGYLVTQVQDIVENDGQTAIINAAVEAHMLDNLIYKDDATIVLPAKGEHIYIIGGNTCLAGDIWGTYGFPKPLNVGDYVIFDNALRYTMVKMNWFNGVQMPSIVVKRLDGTIDVVREFTYDDFQKSLS
ncbi:carboxynorspermidine decarboxylase [Candidatus Kaiserbacteria bacterium CG10_big_fil_rev_8_21_14_0_10_51_14]|uniref:Carboxynorspermidine decarboxylase n=1 Tax=Candidatus Kaiserbacteria bacterium CG10_big_fil_rev_8_21_14_0_10_51_14 TaxID=1974610 RepID=A0A2H0UBI4_9BACT|nr:MAG: carboxynorspermidine decarboxylase [Candidatus Kaiserbacteria bacterium CG10_big_fil_rev_8_21_14_0_10_51_14]